MSPRVVILAGLVGLGLVSPGCGQTSPALVEDWVDRGGGTTLHLQGGGFSGHGAVLVSVDGIPARGVVIDGRDLSFEVPALPREGHVDVELRFADGHEMRLESVLEVRAQTRLSRARRGTAADR